MLCLAWMLPYPMLVSFSLSTPCIQPQFSCFRVPSVSLQDTCHDPVGQDQQLTSVVLEDEGEKV